jgi:hypothetical protein
MNTPVSPSRNESETPRSDAARIYATQAVPIELARQLERELADARMDFEGRKASEEYAVAEANRLRAEITALRSAVSETQPRWKRGDRRVVCAACRDPEGRIVTGARHFDAVMMEQIKRSTKPEAWRAGEQGFIDQFGAFLTRE